MSDCQPGITVNLNYEEKTIVLSSARVFYILLHFFAVHFLATMSNHQIWGYMEEMTTRR